MPTRNGRMCSALSIVGGRHEKIPEILNPVKAKVNEDRRVEWLSYKNIMEWTARAKEFLITIEMAKDEPGIIRECACYALATMVHSVTHLSFLSFLLLQY